MMKKPLPQGVRRQRQGGIVLIIALIMMVALTLLGVAVVRSVDTGNQVANNIGFKQSSVASGDTGTEVAIAWLTANTAALTADSTANAAAGYYATEQTGSDYTGLTTPTLSTDDVDWSGTSGARRAKVVRFKYASGAYVGVCPVAEEGSAACTTRDPAGNGVAYIIQRMCDAAGAFSAGAAISCATSSAAVASTSASKGAVSYGRTAISTKAMLYYRITTRISGPRNSLSYVQSMALVEY